MGCWDNETLNTKQPQEILSVVACVLVDADGRILLADRPEGKYMAGYWEFPGGKVEVGELPETALVRELHEELGIETRNSCLAPLTFVSHSYEKYHVILKVFVCRVWEGIPQARENQKVIWVKKEDLNKYQILPASLEVLPFIREIL